MTSSDIHDLCGQPVEAHTLGPDGKALCPKSGIDAGVLRQGAPTGDELSRRFNSLFGQPDPGSLSAPVPHSEPPIYTVISFRIRHSGASGTVYDYAAVRAGDGKWCVTGGETRQGVDWATIVRAVRARLVGPITVMGPVRQVFL